LFCGELIGEVSDRKKERIEQVKLSVKQKQRLISRLKLLRTESELGIGDTAHRIVQLVKRNGKAHDAIKRLLAQCSCSRSDAVAKLNQQWPY